MIYMQNGISQHRYRGCNALLLGLMAQIKHYQDPRWYTFNQIRDNQYKLIKGSKGVPVEYWLLFNKKENKYLSFEQAKIEIKKNPDIEKFLQLRCRTSYVFNADCIQGLPEYKLTSHPILIGTDLEIALDQLIKGMDIDVRISDFANSAYYQPTEDYVSIPSPKVFKSESGYASTLLHELAHATGHSKRLNRDLTGKFGSEKYAMEELRVELAASLLSEFFPYELTEKHLDNHKAYIQSWISVLDNDPNILFRAIKEAEQIADYMENIVGLDLYVVNDEQMLDYSSNSSQNLTLEIF